MYLGSKYAVFYSHVCVFFHQMSKNALDIASICLRRLTKEEHPGSTPLYLHLTPTKTPGQPQLYPSLIICFLTTCPHITLTDSDDGAGIQAPLIDHLLESSHCEIAWALTPSFARNSGSARVCWEGVGIGRREGRGGGAGEEERWYILINHYFGGWGLFDKET